MYRKIESELSLGVSPAGTSNCTMPSSPAPLARTSSLPPEAGEWSRKRKERQSLQRVGVKKKQREKMAGSRPLMSEAGSGVPAAESSRSAELRRKSFDFGRSPEGYDISGSSNPSLATSLPDTGHQFVAAADPLPPRLRTLKSLQEDGASKRAAGNLNRQKEMGRNIIDEMPCVSVRGCRRIEGFLYKYRRSEEVRIVCVCHGNFFTPAEFVKHAGGGDVTHPLKHIVVNPSPPVYY